jgi:hypothetical protein
VDWNSDGKLDLIAGDNPGQVWLFLNVGSRKEPKLAEGVRVEAAGKPIRGAQKTYKQVDGKYVVDNVTPGNHPLADIYSKIHFADWNGDGLPDLLIGQDTNVLFYKNVGAKASPKFEDPVALAIPKETPMRPSPYLYDWDGDGITDLLLGTEDGKVLFYHNVGTKTKVELAPGKVLLDLKGVDVKPKGDRCRIAITDWNNDGKPDILAGDCYFTKDAKAGGNVWLFLGR